MAGKCGLIFRVTVGGDPHAAGGGFNSVWRMRTIRKSVIILLLALLIQPAASAVAGDRKGPSKKEVKQMIEFGISLGKQGLWKEALFRWREALRYDPDNPQLLNNIAVALESQGDLEGARVAYTQAKELAGRARYIDRNIEDFEELFTALKAYEEQYRKPSADQEEQADAAGAGASEVAEDGGATGEDAAGGETETAPAPEEQKK